MRKLSVTKAILHALNSVWSYRQVALRIGLVWLPVLLICGIAEVVTGQADGPPEDFSIGSLVEIISGVVSIIAVCSMAVSWHRFILRDEVSHGMRLDGNVMRYAGTTILIMLSLILPTLLIAAFMLIAAFTLVAPASAIFGLPAIALLGGLVTRASIKLPAVALGDRSFSFRNAWKVSEGNFWPCVGVFLLNSVIMFAGLLVLVALGSLVKQGSETLAAFVLTAGSILLQLFFGFFNASVLTSLYGFFVERRDF
jgi:hypothetical protein